MPSDWLQTLQADPLIGTLTVLALFCAVAMRQPEKISQERRRDREDDDVHRATNTGILRRLWWNLRPPHDLMRVDGLAVDRTRKPHAAWLGPTGAGKSQSVASVRVDGKRPTLVVTPDISDPMRDAALRQGGFLWTACVSTVRVNFLLGSPTEVAERLTEVFRSGGVGAWKRAARRATAEVIRLIDASSEPRTLQGIGELLAERVSSDRELKVVCAGWVSRFLDLADQFGPSIGSDGVDLADLLKGGATVLLDNDSFDHPSLGGDVVALGLAEAKRCASLVPGGFRLIFEEAGQLGDRIDLADPFFRAGRRRQIMVDALTQAESDLDEGISANIATRFYFAQELKSLQKVAADRLGLDYRELDPASMRDFTAWACHGRIRRLIHFPKPPKTQELIVSTNGHPYGENEDTKNGHRWAVVELPRRNGNGHSEVGPLALPPPSTTLQNILKDLYPEGDCERWAGKHDRAGHRKMVNGKETYCPLECAIEKHVNGCYGLVHVDGRWQRVHRLRWEMAYGRIPLNPDGTVQTLDHMRGCPKDCSKIVHLSLCTRGENSRRRWRVVGR